MLASLTTNFRYTVYNALINFGYIWMNFGEFFSGILVYHYPPGRHWPIERYQTSDKGERKAWRVNVEKYTKSGLHLPNLMNQHLLVQAIDTKRKLMVNNNRKLQELFLSPSPRSNVVTVHIKRTGKALPFFIC